MQTDPPYPRSSRVVAWLRLRVPPGEAPVPLPGSPAPPPLPPLDVLAQRRVATDPRKRIYELERPHGDGWVVLRWDADDPDHLDAEWRRPSYVRPTPDGLRAFWAAVKVELAPLGPVPVESADPVP